MLRGFYDAAAGMITQQRLVDMYTNNITNAQTPGYKADRASIRAFPEMMLNAYGTMGVPNTGLPQSYTKVGALNTAAYVQEISADFSTGSIKQTGLSTDVALIEGNIPYNAQAKTKGSLFFTVQDAQGNIRYTKDGHFQLDSRGNLTTPEGYKVLGVNGQPIVVQGTMKITQNGQVYDNNQLVGQLNIAFSSNPYLLKKEGNGLFYLDNNAILPTALNTPNVTFGVSQGYVEQSNIDLGQETTNYMLAYRSFEANQRVLQSMDKSLDLAVNSVGKLQ